MSADLIAELTDERIDFVNRLVNEAWQLMSINGLTLAEGVLVVCQFVDRLGELAASYGEDDVDTCVDQVIDAITRLHQYVKTGDEQAVIHGP